MNGLPKIEVMGLRKLENGKIKAFADLLFDDSYIVKGFRIVDGNEGRFVGFPQQLSKGGKWFDIFLAVNDEIKEVISEKVLASYQE